MKKHHREFSKGFTQAPAAGAGFTLIELLVVIAIIGILSAVVLASLNTARAKGADAAIKSDLQSVRDEAEVYYDGTGGNTYGAAMTAAVCPGTGTMFSDDTSIADAIANAVTAAGKTDTVCATDGSNSYFVIVPLKTSGYWCIDSSGQSKGEDGNGNGTGYSGYACL
ncbi:MAG TPA: type II secretion system protein [Candidatus Paceibacterota bacterium]|jgi:prepilin-type N-terminal cleavage/methylation domain-containing protein|nr:type II secretion system protein [Candidatus Paceibacterota bacterium]